MDVENKDISLDFSVVVCCYNPNLEKLKKTLISIFKQQNVSYEIIISDDGSPVHYFDEIKEWMLQIGQRINVKYNSLEKNVGTIKNIISALSLAKGHYCKVISPGDYFFDVNALYEYKKAFENDVYDIVFSDSVYYAGRDIIRKRKYPYNRLVFNKKRIKKAYCIYGNYFLGATIAAKTFVEIELLKRVKDKVKLLEDFSMMTLAFMDELKINGVEKPLIWYEYGTGVSTLGKTNTQLLLDTKTVYEIILADYPHSKLARKMYKKYIFSLKNKLYKIIVGWILFPGIFTNKFLRLVHGPRKNVCKIEQLDEITQWRFE